MKNEIYETLLTPYAEEMNESAPWSVYPRPQLKRDSFFSLNGKWDFKIVTNLDTTPYFEGEILVPFPPESKLSGVEKRIPDNATLIYKRSFTLPRDFKSERVILHFGAVDQIASVFINEKEVGTHTGGYIPFSFDITDLLLDGENEITVRAIDELSKTYTYGKQRKNRGGMWYTPVSGIWQTVWIESVPKNYVESIKIDPLSEAVKITVNSDAERKKLTLKSGEVYEFTEKSVIVEPREKHFWTPENPYLYEFTIETETDKVESYFALRTLEIKEINGKNRLCLNGKPYFFSGLLDQGYFPDGIFLPATEKGYEDDILNAKRLGFNMLRKHIKIEPMIFYYLCDKLGMVVFQDMVNNSGYSFILDTAMPTIGFKKARLSLRHRNKESREFFLSEMEKTAELLYNVPSVCLYTIFNEGWGQFMPDEAYRALRKIDSTRFIDSTSGWFYAADSDVDSRHIYFKAPKIKNPNGRPFFLSEFGGFSLRIEGHLFGKRNYGYSIYNDKESFTDAVYSLYTADTLPLIKDGLSATVYTQLTDVEDETNGLITYDRRVLKIDEEKMKDANEKLYKAFSDCTRIIK